MVDRLIIGAHPHRNEMGIWMSEPGWDVKTAPRDRMQIVGDAKSVQMVTSGITGLLAYGETATIYYPYVLDRTPVVTVWHCLNYSFIPHPVEDGTRPTQYSFGDYRVEILSYLDRCTINSGAVFSNQYYYAVYFSRVA